MTRALPAAPIEQLGAFTDTTTIDGVALAHLYGEPLFDLPSDLYIPPDALEVFLETFTGPLDLLLYLIRKQNLNILDIPMAQVTTQYLNYVAQIRHRNLELAAEYLLMAALLIEIKTATLLPPTIDPNQEEIVDPRATLVQRLLIYEQVRTAAQELALLPQQGYDFLTSHAYNDFQPVVHLPNVSAQDLWQTWQALIKRAQLTQNHRIERESLSVRDTMAQILRQLKSHNAIEFSDLLAVTQNLSQLVIHFIAILELSREQLVHIEQINAGAPIYLRLAFTPQ